MFSGDRARKGKEKRCLFPTRGWRMDSHSFLVSSGKGVNDGSQCLLHRAVVYRLDTVSRNHFPDTWAWGQSREEMGHSEVSQLGFLAQRAHLHSPSQHGVCCH